MSRDARVEGSAERPPGYLVVVDADGAEVEGSRRDVTGRTREQALRIRAELEAAICPDCSVEFKLA